MTTRLLALVLVACVSSSLRADEAPNHVANHGKMNRLFTLKLLPLFKDKCLGCHGQEEGDLKGDYDMRTREALLRGGESDEVAIVPGDADESPFFEAVTWDGLEMPPKENDRLTEGQTGWIRQWIEAGAPWPSEEEQQVLRDEAKTVLENEDGVLISTSGGLSDQWTDRRYHKSEIWAFMPVRTDFQYDSVDDFVEMRLREAGLSAAPAADPQELIRRASYDLIGLPPTMTETQTFIEAHAKNSESAWAELIDRLLASPHYGERWAQHWLDVVRYADTGGLSNDYERSNAWRYRDYVIRSFNEDKPYDEFVVEQIAGDELAAEEADKDAVDPVRKTECTIATGFLRMGPWETAMIPQEEARQLFRDDVVHSIGTSFLSMPMRCCKCHDHKFDPIPTRDYYRMYAAVSASQPSELPADFLLEENCDGFESGEAVVNQLYQYAKQRVDKLLKKQEVAARAWYDEHELQYKGLDARKEDPVDDKPARHCGLTEVEQGQLKVREQDVWIWERRKERYQPLAQSVFNGPNQDQNARKLRPPKKVKSKPMTNTDASVESFIFLGGAYTAKGESVTPGVLSGCRLSVDGAPTDDPYALPTTIEGRRLALARWIAHPDNPMTARSIVNRIWQHHFGRGIVATPNNFGVKGAAPTHPELLDWLTRSFIAGGWKSKPLHRALMLSKAYQRSARHPNPDRVDAVDPNDELYARALPRRLTAEEIRDTLLAVTGELNRTIGGLPARPEINQEVALEPRMIQFSLAPAYQPSPTRKERNRRSIYSYRVRGQADPFLEVLNKPNPNDSCDLRDDAAVSPQAFTFLNSDVMSDRAIALAVRIKSEVGQEEVATRVNRVFQLALGRSATPEQIVRLSQYVQAMKTYHEGVHPKPAKYPTEITRSLVEEFSGRPFEYTEWLPIFENYEPDFKPADMDAATRALADLCLLLFNTNEFIYVD